MYRIRRFGVLRTSNVFAILYLLITAVFVIPFALILLVAGPTTTTDAFGNTAQVGASVLVLLLVPFIYAAFGWIFTAIFCLIYNLASRFVGGIEVEVEGGPTTSTPPAQNAPYPPA